MKNRILSLLLLLCLLASLCLPVLATEVQSFGNGFTWSLDGSTLTVSGSGNMPDFTEGGAPWAAHKNQISRVVFTGGITYVGAYSFKDYDGITSVDFGSAMYEIGAEAFRGCDGLTALHMPASFKVFGKNCLRGCTNLTAIHCAGRFPSFRSNCLWDTYAKIYFPVERPWGIEYIKQLEEAFNGRIEFLASDGTDPYDPSLETTAPTEETTVPTVETTAPTEETTEPTEETTVPTEETAAPTAPPTAPPPQTAPPTAPQETVPPPAEPGGINWAGWILGLLALVLLMSLVTWIFLANQKQGKYSAKKKKR